MSCNGGLENGTGAVVINVIDTTTSELASRTSITPPTNGTRAKRPSLHTLRVEQLREEGCSSPGSSAYNSEDSEFSDTDILNRLGEFVIPPDDLCQKIAEQVRLISVISLLI